jgi:short-subunit dehydrogenase
MNRLPLRTVMITGASGSIGAALAHAYAAPGVRLILHGRDEKKLKTVADYCEQKGATVVLGLFDLTDIIQAQAWVQDIDCQYPLDLVIVNQGVNTNIGPDGAGEEWAQIERLLDVNLRATMALAHAAALTMKARGHGQIALMSSLAGFFGLPLTPAYSASKAGVKAYGEALHGWLAPYGVHVTVVMPGYVDSAMFQAMPGPKPFVWTPERAAKLIKRRLALHHARISFPFPLNIGCWFLAVLPPRLSIKILRLLGYRAN